MISIRTTRRTSRRNGAEARDGWTLVREGEVLHEGQKVFVPDFVFRHDDGRVVLMEIIGFWTPEYLEAKAATLRPSAANRFFWRSPKPFARNCPICPPPWWSLSNRR